MAGAVGIEPTLTVLETVVLPLNYAPKIILSTEPRLLTMRFYNKTYMKFRQ